jgi:hypothetical protein
LFRTRRRRAREPDYPKRDGLRTPGDITPLTLIAAPSAETEVQRPEPVA